MNCKQRTRDGECENEADYRFTWPGKDESFICEEHVGKLRGIASAMGMYLQIVPIDKEVRP